MILAPVIVPGIALALGLHAVFTRRGLTRRLTGVVLVHLVPTFPYMTQVRAGISANCDRACKCHALSLGATAPHTFRHITLPAILPGINVDVLFDFLFSWSHCVLTLLFGGGRVVTLPLPLFNIASAGRNDITDAIGLVQILPGTLILRFTARHLSDTNGALSGFGRR